jgi:hypothetical protein
MAIAHTGVDIVNLDKAMYHNARKVGVMEVRRIRQQRVSSGKVGVCSKGKTIDGWVYPSLARRREKRPRKCRELAQANETRIVIV